MPPEKFAKLLVELAESDPIYDNPRAVDELIYLLAWYVWDFVDAAAPEWTEGMGRALDRLRPGITSKGSHERFAAYSKAKQNDSGGGPVWHITRTFQNYVLGSAPLNADQVMQVSIRITALMKTAQNLLPGGKDSH